MQVSNTVAFLSAMTLATFGVAHIAVAADLPAQATVSVDGNTTTVDTDAHVVTPKGVSHTHETASQGITANDDGSVSESVTEGATTTSTVHHDADETPAEVETPSDD